MSTRVKSTTESMYRRTIGDDVGRDKVASGSGWIHFHRRDALRSVSTTGDIPKSAHPFTGNKLVWKMYSRFIVYDRRVIVSTFWRKGGGRIDVLSDVYCATGSVIRRLLNVVGIWGSGDAESRRNASLRIDRGRQSKEQYGSNK